MKTEKLSNILSPFRRAKDKIENLLETPNGTPSKDSELVKAELFEPSTDLSQIENIRMSLPGDLEGKVKKLFTRMSPYFNSGVLWKQAQAQTFPIAGFCRNIAFEMSAQDLQKEFRFPKISLIEIMKSHSDSLLEQLILWEMQPSETAHVLFFSPHPEYVFLVVSELPDIFLKSHAEKIQKEILLSLGDEVE